MSLLNEPDAPPTIQVPDIACASDEELRALFSRLDGAWSEQTQALMRRFKLDRLQLDENWAGLPPAWQCPGCRRWKPQIARPTAAGVLLCQLVNHHDHTGDRIKRLVVEAGLPEPNQDRVELWRAVELCRPIAERFWPAIICGDCNTAEGQAKLKLRGTIPSDFSFSVAEIARFVRPQPNEPIEVDIDVARSIWAELADDYARRLTFIDELVTRIRTGELRKQGCRYSEQPGTSSRDLLHMAATSRRDRAPMVYNLVTDMSRRSVVRQGLGSSGRKAGIAEPVTDDEFAAFDARQGQNTWWKCVAQDWACPVCERGRREIVRRSNAGRLTGELFRIWDYVPETNPEALDHRLNEGDLVFGSTKPLMVCQDCRHLISVAKARDPDCDETAYSARTLSGLIQTVAPHQMHVFDLDKVVRTGQRNFEYRAAVQAFREHCSEAASAMYAVKSYSDHFRVDFDDAIDEVAAEWVGSGDPDMLTYETERLHWLIDEAQRLAADDAVTAAMRPKATRA